MNPTDTAVERGSGNVFADLGFPDADAHLIKAELVSRIGIVRVAPLPIEAARGPVPARRVAADRWTSASIRWSACSACGAKRDIDIVIVPPTAHGCASRRRTRLNATGHQGLPPNRESNPSMGVPPGPATSLSPIPAALSMTYGG